MTERERETETETETKTPTHPDDVRMAKLQQTLHLFDGAEVHAKLTLFPEHLHKGAKRQ